MWADLNIFIVKETEEMLMSPNKYPSIVESIKQEYAKENGITDTLVLYGTQSFVKDTRLRF